MKQNMIKKSGLRGLIVICGFVTLCNQAISAAELPTEPALTLEVRQFSVEGDNPLSDAETQELLKPYLGKHDSLDSLEAAPAALEGAMHRRGYVFHRVIIPAQRPEDGNIKLQVVRYRLNKVDVTGNNFFSSENILRSLPGLEIDKSPDVAELTGEMATANQHPSKRITLVIKESAAEQALDAEIRVRDVPTRQAFISLVGHTRDENNAINHGTGYSRVTFGYQAANLFDRDHVLTATYTTSPDHISDVTQVGLFYWIPFYGIQSSLSAYATYSDIQIGSLGVGSQSFDVSGRGEFYGLRFDHSFRKFNQINHGISIALDDRLFKSDVKFGGVGLPTNEVSSRPISLRYFAGTERSWGNASAYVEEAFNIRGGRAGDDTDYQNARNGADPNWKAFRYGVDSNYAFASGWTLSGKLRGQYTDEPLIPGEQFGLGGDNSVRGLRDREIAGDQGYFVSAELKAPALKWGLEPVGFIDHGGRHNVKTVIGVPDTDSASSLGLGLRWKSQSKFEAKVDFAHVINGIEGGTPAGNNKLHFSAFYRF